ncbi:hypothetical protein D3C81_2179820 [compost metagenome]
MLPAAFRFQRHLVATGRQIEFEGVLHVQYEVEGQVAVIGNHQRPEIEITEKADGVVQ